MKKNKNPRRFIYVDNRGFLHPVFCTIQNEIWRIGEGGKQVESYILNTEYGIYICVNKKEIIRRKVWTKRGKWGRLHPSNFR